MARLLLVEDDVRIRSALLRSLTERGHAVDHVDKGMPAIEKVMNGAFDLVVLDLGLPDVDGIDLLRMLRGVSDVPVVVSTARDDEAVIVRTLDAGADDYLVKPFSGAQLEARVRAVLRRRETASAQEEIVVGGLVIDIAGREAMLDGKPLELTRKEFDLLAHLAGRAGQVVTRDEIVAEVWRQPLGGADRTLDVHVSWLRKKLGESANEPRYLHTVRGVGIKMVDPGRT